MNTPSKTGRTKRAKAAKELREPAEMFFYDHAGYSHNPKTETAEQGHIRCARSMAEAEFRAVRFVRENGWHFQWQDDWSIGNHRDYYGEDSAYADHKPDTCESCALLDGEGNHLASCGCIDDADTNYRRVIEAELACEALAEVDRKENTVRGFVKRM